MGKRPLDKPQYHFYEKGKTHASGEPEYRKLKGITSKELRKIEEH